MLHGIKFKAPLNKLLPDIPPLLKKIVIPSLTGQIVFSCIARNAFPEIMNHYKDEWGEWIRLVCLTIILLRAGLEFEFKNKGLTVLLLSIIPPTCEGSAIALVAHFLLKINVPLSFALGFGTGAVSPAVLVPICMMLQEKGYGVAKGIPVIMMAASSIDDVYAITLFGICTSIAFAEVGSAKKKSIGMILLRVLLEVVTGIAAGALLGLVAYLFKDCSTKVKGVFVVIIAVTMAITFEMIHFEESKYLAVITFGYVCSRIWQNAYEKSKTHNPILDTPHTLKTEKHHSMNSHPDPPIETHQIEMHQIEEHHSHEEDEYKPEKELKLIWNLVKPLMFGTVGAALQISHLNGSTVGYGIIVIFIGVTVRLIATYVSVCSKKFNVKERVFIAICWLPKATVQAALATIVLHEAKVLKEPEYIVAGEIILTILLLSIIFTAPSGAILSMTLGTKFLEQHVKGEQKAKQSIGDSPTNKISLGNDFEIKRKTSIVTKIFI